MTIPTGIRVRALWMATAACLVVLTLNSVVVSSTAPFGPNVSISDGAGLSNEHKATVVADESGNVYAAWGQNRNGDTDLYFSKSADGGRTWSLAKRIGGNPPTGSTQDRPSLALGPNGEVVAAWQDDRLTYFDFDIYASVSIDGGGNFTPAVRVSDGPPGSLQIAPTVAVGGNGRVAVAWQDYRTGSGAIRVSAASLPALSFGGSVRADDDPGAWTAAAPSVAATATGVIYVAYHDNRSGSADAYLARSTDGGSSFGRSVRIDDTGGASSAQGLVSIAADGVGRVYAVWEDSRVGELTADGRPIFDIFFSKSVDGGLSFSKNVRVDDGPRKTSQEAPRIVIGAAGTIYVVWDDARNTDWDPYFSYSTNDGTTFASNLRLDDAGDSITDPPVQYDPQVVESRTGLVFSLWEDARGATSDIYGTTAYFAVGSALRVRVGLDAQTAWPGDPVPFTVRVRDNGTPVDNATIAFSSTGAGAFGVVQGIGGGLYRSSFTSSSSTPNGTDLVITATAQKPGFVAGSSQALLFIRKTLLVAVEPTWDLLAVGQSTPVRVSASAHGAPVPGAVASVWASGGGTMSPASGTTDAQGYWSTSFTPGGSAGGTNATVSAAVSRDGYVSATGAATVAVLAQPRTASVVLSSATREMMSRERANFRVDVTSGGSGVTHAVLTLLCVRGGSFSTVTETEPGVYRFSWQAPDVSSQTWASIAVRVQRGGYSDVSVRLSILVDPNMTRPTDPTQLFVFVLPESTVVPGGHSIQIILYVYTLQGFVVSGATVSVLVSGGMGTVTPATDALNGKYTFVYTAPNVASSTGILLRMDASKLGYATGSARIVLMLTP